MDGTMKDQLGEVRIALGPMTRSRARASVRAAAPFLETDTPRSEQSCVSHLAMRARCTAAGQEDKAGLLRMRFTAMPFDSGCYIGELTI